MSLSVKNIQRIYSGGSLVLQATESWAGPGNEATPEVVW